MSKLSKYIDDVNDFASSEEFVRLSDWKLPESSGLSAFNNSDDRMKVGIDLLLIFALHDFNKQSSRQNRIMILLTRWIAALTVVMTFATLVVIFIK